MTDYHNRRKRWFKNYRARMDSGFEPCRNGCGRRAVTFDHIAPITAGGRGGSRNITLLCEQCNHEKDMKLWGWLLPVAYEADFAEIVGADAGCYVE